MPVAAQVVSRSEMFPVRNILARDRFVSTLVIVCFLSIARRYRYIKESPLQAILARDTKANATRHMVREDEGGKKQIALWQKRMLKHSTYLSICIL